MGGGGCSPPFVEDVGTKYLCTGTVKPESSEAPWFVFVYDDVINKVKDLLKIHFASI